MISCTATLGKVGINKIPLTTNQQINALILKENIGLLKEYLAYLFKYYSYKDILERLTNNPSVKHININTLKSLKIPLPPMEVQEKLVSEIEEIETQISKLKEETQKIREEINEILRGYL